MVFQREPSSRSTFLAILSLSFFLSPSKLRILSSRIWLWWFADNWTCLIGSSCRVEFYEHCSFKGYKHTYTQTTAYTGGGDEYSSLKIINCPNKDVILFEHPNGCIGHSVIDQTNSKPWFRSEIVRAFFNILTFGWQILHFKRFLFNLWVGYLSYYFVDKVLNIRLNSNIRYAKGIQNETSLICFTKNGLSQKRCRMEDVFVKTGCPNFGGRRHRVVGTEISCLADKSFNDVIDSFKIEQRTFRDFFTINTKNYQFVLFVGG